MTTLLEVQTTEPATTASPAHCPPCPAWCLGDEHHRVHGMDECAGEAVEVLPGLVTWPVARRGGPVRFSVATIRPDVTVTA